MTTEFFDGDNFCDFCGFLCAQCAIRNVKISQLTEVLPPWKFGCQLCTGHKQTKSSIRYVITRNGWFLERGESSPHMRILSSYEARGHIDTRFKRGTE